MSYHQPVCLGRDGKLGTQSFPQKTRRTFVVDSRDRDFGAHPASSAFKVRLPETLHHVSSAVLISAELPLSYYVFSAARRNTTLVVGLAPGARLPVTIPDGNYNAAAMASALGAALDAAFAGAATFGVAFDPVTLKCTITCSHAFYIDTTEVATGTSKRTEWGLGYYLGMPRGVQTASAGGKITGTLVANLNPENYLLVHIEHMNDIGQTGTGHKAFAKVPLNGDSYQFQYYDKTLSFVDIRPPLQTVEALQVSIRFHDGTLVDLNGGEWSMSLEFVCTHTQPV